MTIQEAIQEAFREGSGLKAGRVADLLRFKYNVDYEGMMRIVERSGVNRLEWDALLQEADTLGAYK